MTFADATVLTALPIVVGIALWCVRRLRGQQAQTATRFIAHLWVDRHGLSNARPVLRGALYGFAVVSGVALAVVALARPQWGQIEQKTYEPAREILLALDLSSSMNADDVPPTRLQRSKLLVETLLDTLQGERVGLLVFAGTGFLQSPLSADHEVLRDLLSELDPSYLPQGGTNYDDMLRAALDAFGQDTQADRFLIVLSDGESHAPHWRKRVPALREEDIRVIGLGVGTSDGAVLTDSSGAIVKDERGAAVLSRLEEATLRELAESTGGTYRDAAAWVDIAALVDETVERGQRGEFVDERVVRRRERFQWLLAPALLFLLISAWLELPVVPTASSLRMRRKEGITALGTALLFTTAALPLRAEPMDAVPREPTPPERLTRTVSDMIRQPQIGADRYHELAKHSLEAVSDPGGLEPQVRNGVIFDALAAIELGEQLDPDTTDWSELRRRLEALARETPPPPSPQQAPSDPSRDDDSANSESEPQPGDSGAQEDPNPRDSDSTQSNPGDAPPEENTRRSDASPKPDAGADQALPDTLNDPDAGLGSLGEPPAEPSPPAGEPKSEDPPPETRLVGGGRATPDGVERPELAEALGRLQQVRDQDSPAVLFQRMNGGERTRTQGGKPW
ncbi:VWA domain-containing protein [Myxococcota bacterium]|nr:VWA domain-containing protein [Myxococcota bacterium]